MIQGRRGLQGVNDNEKTLVRRGGEKDIKETVFRKRRDSD